MGRALAFLGRIFILLLGRWTPPDWMRWIGVKGELGGKWAWHHKLKSCLVLIIISGSCVGGMMGWRWWKARPRPFEVQLRISNPPLTPIGEKVIPRPMVIAFSTSVANLKAVGRVVKQGIEVQPKIDGTWKWTSDHELELRPHTDWPIGQTFQVTLARKGLIADHVRLSEYKASFETAPFTVYVRSTEFYQDPVDPDLKKVVAEVGFSHAVDALSFEKNIKLRFEPSNKQEKAFDLPASITYDKWKARAFIHSAPFALQKKESTVHFTILSGSRATQGGPAFSEEIKRQISVPGLQNFFRIQSSRVDIVDNPRLEPEQLFLLELTAAATEKAMSKAIEAWILPVKNPREKEREGAYHWDQAEAIDPGILAKATKLPLQAVTPEKEYVSAHSFHFKAPPHRYVYLRVKKGVTAFGGYILDDDYQTILQVPAFPRQLKFLHSGSLLALGGKRQVGLFARDIPGVRLEIARILPNQIHHYFSFSSGHFSQGNLDYPMRPEHLAELSVETRTLVATPGKPIYDTLDLGNYLDVAGTERRGLFLVTAESINPTTQERLGERDTRLLLVTDLGMVAKEGTDGTRDIFVQSIVSGRPVSGAKVHVLGRNGQSVLNVTTDSEGHARLPSLRELRQEKVPVALQVISGRDTSYLPLEKRDRLMNVSRFDVGGVEENQKSQGLTAYLFSDRGVYRPGDEIHLGAFVRSRDLDLDIAGLPLELVITDPRGLEVKRDRFKLGPTGLETLDYRTQEASPTGEYTAALYTVKDKAAEGLIGRVKMTVREFLPDRMMIQTHFTGETPSGWVSPKGLAGLVSLANLFGTPATQRRVRSKLMFQPGMPSFPHLRDYHFFNPQKPIETTEQNLADMQTDENGKVTIPLGLDRFAASTYRLTLICDGFEMEGGRSVTAEASTVVSSRPWLIGFKPDGDIRYIPKDTKRFINLVAVGPGGNQVAVKSLQIVYLERRYISSLVRLENGTYRYQSIRKDIEISRAPIDISEAGRKYPLPTDKSGDFLLALRQSDGETVQEISFSVTGAGNLTRSMEKNSELQLSLHKADLAQGDDIELQIKAPYTGSGLITIERDRVYAWKWFKSNDTTTIQRIRVPSDLEGGGYVSVSFVRDPASDEVFASPLSYAVAPFSMNHDKRKLNITVATKELVKPGTRFHMKVSADRPGRALVFAVDEGILRVARYTPPDPLEFFLQKRALGVETMQILDLILPEYRKLIETAAPGGDNEAKALGANINPFRRRQDKPVVYWSGMIDVGPQAKDLVYEIPDSFNGTLRVMAVGSAVGSLGAFNQKTLVRGDFVITPNVPTFAAPGDELDISVGLANQVAGSGKQAKPVLSLSTSKHLEIIGAHEQVLTVGEMGEGSTRFRIKAKSELGSASLKFEARLGDKKAKFTTSLSVRPLSPFVTTIQAGYVKNGEKQVLTPRRMFSEFRTLKASLAAGPLSLVQGLSSYLKDFPHNCTEQVVSQAVPAIAFANRHDVLGMDRETALSTVNTMVAILQSRQNDEGGFGLWAANPKSAPMASVWALHVLTDAKNRGYTIPKELMEHGMRYLQGLADRTPDNLNDARLQAHAIYVLARNERQIGRQAAGLQRYLQANDPKEWQGDLASAYLAASYAITQQTSLADELSSAMKLGGKHTANYAYYYDVLAHDAQLLALLSQHFPRKAAAIDSAKLDGIVNAIAGGNYNTYSSACSIAALEHYVRVASEPGAATRTVYEVLPSGRKPLSLSPGTIPRGAFSPEASALVFDSRGSFGSYFSVTQAGFDREPEKKSMTNSLEIAREYLSKEGNVITQTSLGDEIQVRLRVRSLADSIPQVAIVDLLPAGFEVVINPSQSLNVQDNNQSNDRAPAANEEDGQGEEGGNEEGDEFARAESDEAPSQAMQAGLAIAQNGSDLEVDYVDIREDRVVLYATIDPTIRTFLYNIKATNTGNVRCPAIHAESLYDRMVRAHGEPGHFTIVRP